MSVRSIDPDLVWFSRMGLNEYASDFAAKHFPNDGWELELLVGNTKNGGMKEAEEYGKKIFAVLDNDKKANDLRDLANKISSQGREINSMIEKEVKKH